MGKNSIERILYIDHQIREQCHPSRESLAEHWEVSIKTIERDLEFMKTRLYAPIEYNRTIKGYYYSDEGYFIPAFYLKQEDRTSLQTSLYMREINNVTDFFGKVVKVLPNKNVISEESFEKQITYIDEYSEADSNLCKILLQASLEKRKVILQYRAPGYSESVKKIVHPYQLVHYRNYWYLLALDEKSDKVKSYAFLRIQKAKMTTNDFSLPINFSIDNYIDSNFSIYQRSKTFQVILHTSPATADILNEHLPFNDKKIVNLPDGKKEIKFSCNQEEELLHLILSWGIFIEVIEPQKIRDRLRNVGNYYIEKYS